MKTKNLIRDGQTRRGFVAPAVDGLHEGLDFEFRPMLAEQVEQTEDEYERADTPRDGILLLAGRIADHLVSWSEVDDSGERLAPRFEFVRLLPHPLMRRVYRVLTRQDASDEPPKSTPDETRERLEELRRRAAGVSPAEDQNEQLGNSDAG
jgi:hypothetical protein